MKVLGFIEEFAVKTLKKVVLQLLQPVDVGLLQHGSLVKVVLALGFILIFLILFDDMGSPLTRHGFQNLVIIDVDIVSIIRVEQLQFVFQQGHLP